MFSSDGLILAEDRGVFRLDLVEEAVETLLGLQAAIQAVTFFRGGVELNFVGAALVVDLAEDDLQQLPKGFRFLKSLISSDVIVAAAKCKKQSIG